MAKNSFLAQVTFKPLPFRTATIYWQGFTLLDCTVKYFPFGWSEISSGKVSVIFLFKVLVIVMMDSSIPFSWRRHLISSSKSLTRKASFPHIMRLLTASKILRRHSPPTKTKWRLKFCRCISCLEMIKSPLPQKKVLQKYYRSAPQKKQIISGSDHKTAKTFVNINNSSFCRIPTRGSFCKYSTWLVLNNNLWKQKKTNIMQ